MIKINRTISTESTALLKSEKVKTELNKLKTLVKTGKLTSKDFDSSIWQNQKLKEELFKAQYKKCCYCDRSRDKIEFDVEHFRPKGAVKESKEPHGYWWLAYNLENLLLACKTCNQKYKKTNFPILNESKRAKNESDDLNQEQPLLINPLTEDPEDFIKYDLPDDKNINNNSTMVKAIGINERGEKTIKLTGINDKSVMEERGTQMRLYKFLCISLKSKPKNKEIIQLKNELLLPNRNCYGFAKFYFKKHGILK